MTDAQGRLVDIDGVVGIPAGGDTLPVPLKVVPDNRLDPDLKPDRQARVFLCEFADGYEGVMVMDLGGKQLRVLMRGPDIKHLFHSCVDFYAECGPLTWADVRQLTGSFGGPKVL